MAVVSAGLAGVGLVESPAQSATAGLSVVRVSSDLFQGGTPTTVWGNAGLSVEIADSSPVAGHRYVITALPTNGADKVQQVWTAPDGWEGRVILPVGNQSSIRSGLTYDVTVEEYDGQRRLGRSAARRFALRTVAHPSRLELSPASSIRGGRTLTLRWTGRFAAGTRVTQVVWSRPATGATTADDVLVCRNSFCPGAPGDGYVATTGQTLVTKVFVPSRLVGRRLEVTVWGTRIVDGRPVTRAWGVTRTLRVVR